MTLSPRSTLRTQTCTCSEQNTQQHIQLLPTALYLTRTSVSKLQAGFRNASDNSYGWQTPIILCLFVQSSVAFVQLSPKFLVKLLLKHISQYVNNKVANKGKSVPLQAWSGPEGSRKLRFPDFMTTAQGASKVVSPTHRPHLPPGNSPGTHFS